MSKQGSPFESIESAHGFMGLLAEVIADARQAVDTDLQAASAAAATRRVDALRIASYNLQKLELHVGRSVRILNDLRLLRRLLLEERRAAPRAEAEKAKAKPGGNGKAARSKPVAA